MKKHLLSVLAILLVLSLAACSVRKPSEEEIVKNPTAAKKPTIKEEPAEKRIGRIVTYADFLAELPKRIDLDNYDLESNKFDSGASYTYTAKTDQEIRNSNRNFEVTVDGIKITMPSTVQELLDMGFEAASLVGTGESVDLSAQVRSTSLNMKTPEGNTFRIYATSRDNSPIPLWELTVIQISCEFYDGNINYGVGERSDAPQIKFFKNVDEKATVASILRELKKPQTIYFSETTYRGETTLSTMQLTFHFSNQDYAGSIVATTEAVKDETVERTSYVTNYSYRIDPDSIKIG